MQLPQNHEKRKMPIKKRDDNVCNPCGMTEHWSHTCCAPKQFVDLYQASIKGKKTIELKPFPLKMPLLRLVLKNNALVENAFPALIEAKSLETLDFFLTILMANRIP